MRFGGFAVFFGVTWLLGVLWAFATPLMQVADEISHVRKASSVAHGQLIGSGTVRVPESIARIERPCWLYVTPCRGAPAGRPDVTVEAVSDHSRSHPTYYAAVGLPSLVAPGTWSVYGMRVLSALLFAALITLAAYVASFHPRPQWLLVGLVAGITPMALSLAGGVNPNGLEIAAAAALWVTLMGWLAFPVRVGGPGAGVLSLVAALALVGLRQLSALWLVLMAIAVLLLRTEPIRAMAGRRTAVGLVIAGAATAGAVGWTLWSGSADELVGTESPRYEDLSAIFWDSLRQLGGHLQAMIGTFGWGDNALPFHVVLAWFAVIGLLVIPAFALSDRRARLVLGGLLLATAVLPIILQIPQAAEKGLIWQGRYLLPLTLGIPIVAGLLLARLPDWDRVAGSAMVRTALWILGIAHVAAFWWALHASVAGREGPWLDFEARWQPPGGWIAMTLVYAIAIGLWLGLVFRMGTRPRAGAGGIASAEPGS